MSSATPVTSNNNKTFTITPASSLTGTTSYTIKVTDGIQDLYKARVSITESSFTTNNLCGDSASYCYIFVSNTATDGDIDSLVGGEEDDIGLDEADYICNNDSNKPNSSNYKAMITHRENRHADANWVLRNDTEYRRTDGTIIGTTRTTDTAIFESLTNAISATDEIVWTGLTTVWGKSKNKCSDQNGAAAWKSNLNTDTDEHKGSYGTSGTTNIANAIATGTQTCNNTAKLYCIEQP